MKVSVLNLVPVREDGNYRRAFNEMARLAKKVEELGYERYWIAEHHNTASFASSATQLLIQHTLANTDKIRVGSGGVMLPNHSPYIVAEQYGTLEILYPGRVDLGLGRAPGTDMKTAAALRRNTSGREKSFPKEIAELRSYFKGSSDVSAYPSKGLEIPFYVLGSSTDSAWLAAKSGLPYSFAAHFAPAMMEEAVKIYRDNFQPSEYLQKPYVILGANFVIADTEEEAERLSTTQLQMYISIVTNTQKPLQPPLKTRKDVWERMEKVFEAPHFGPIAFRKEEIIQMEKEIVDRMFSLTLSGNRESVKRQLKNLREKVEFDEIMAVTYIYDEKAQHYSYKLLSEIVKEINEEA